MGKILIIITALLAITICGGCNTTGCTDNQNALPLAGFYSSSTMSSISVDSIDIGGVGAPNDSLLHSTGTSISEVYLPFRSTVGTTAFYFHYTQQSLSNDALNDTITFSYTSTPYFASEECGAMYKYLITQMSHTTHIIDSVAITDSLITNIDTERIKIYFRTTTD